MPRPVLSRLIPAARQARAAARAATLACVAGAVAACASAPRPEPAPTPPGAPVAGTPVAGDTTVVRVLARERATASASAAQGTLAVVPFALATGDTSLTPLAYALADLLTTDLARSPRLTLVERARLGEVLRELALTATGRVDSLTGPRVGKLIQARQLVVGSLGGVPGGSPPNTTTGTGTLRLGVRVADVSTGSIAEAVDASAPLADVLAAEKALAFRIFDELGVTLTPAERAAVEQRPTGNLAALLAYGRGVREEYDGNFRRAVEEYRRAARLDRSFKAAGAREVQARTLSETGTSTPILVPGVRPVDAAVATTVDRLNRPIDAISTLTRPSTAADPSFPVTTTTVVIVINRP